MTHKQEEQNSMLGLVKKDLTEAPDTIIALMPGSGDLIERFTVVYDSLQVDSGKQSVDSKGFAEKKGMLKEGMVDQTMAIVKDARGYAQGNDLTELFREMGRSKTSLMQTPDSNCGNVCRSILNLAAPLADGLLSYGVTALMLTKLDTSITTYDAYVPEPRDKIVDKKQVTAGIAAKIAECTEILVKIDVLVDMIETSQKAFFDKYFDVRKIVKTGGRKNSLMGSVSVAGGVGLSGVRVTIEGHGFKLVKKTSRKGNFTVKILVDGVYVLTLYKAGYKVFTTEIAITAGERTEVRVVMELDGTIRMVMKSA